MAIIHNLKLNNNTNDSVAWSWTVTWLTSQSLQWYNWLYTFASWNNLYISETNTWTNITFAVWTNCSSVTDMDGKVIDARGSWSLAILAYDSAATAYWWTWNGGSSVRVAVAKNVNNRLVWTRDGTTWILYNNWKEIWRYTWTWHTNYTSIRIWQENAWSPNRRYVWSMDEITIDRDTWSGGKVKNDYAYWKGFF